ncbi:Protein-L-isoaspartate(D-aspartate) O-methyltransferase (PCMT) [Xylanibacter ruminicola]|uniref:Protein-L-isoaspartate(D-aspartate) O-methyltransferase (PCMT) n=1 Tax=Xylanibacter ruminicola TaxID=839 RepID=A0A1H5T5X5_XYLRU|nr:SAM-dependent methyltransferase [Xylanibacter ruminicola]SEF57491.1 Protein-L-isoaspartate(D-aspartate) O-methyltransferase (PCMT) [Xylanibacter ruminicola]
MNSETLDFIRQHADDDVRQLALRGTKVPEVNLPYALEQIAGRQKARLKLPSWAANDNIIYPSHLSMEQCSSEQTALYKSAIAGKGQFMVDLTAGFGVDIAFIAKGFQRAVHVERQESLCAISSANYKSLGLKQIEVVCGDGVEYLHQLSHVNLLFIDPARRDEHGGRTYGIADCTPNVLEMRDEMLEKADRVMVKLSPMLDWRKAVADLGKVNEVHIVSVDNECKELLLVLSKEEKSLSVFCVNNGEVFDYRPADSHVSDVPALPQEFRYLYEPNASIMKAGCFELLEQRFGVAQLDKNSHLFVSDKEKTHFPGRQFVIEHQASMNKRELKKVLAGFDKANIAVRNFPLSVAALRKRLKLKEGGDVYIFATTVANEGHQLFVCRKKS